MTVSLISSIKCTRLPLIPITGGAEQPFWKTRYVIKESKLIDPCILPFPESALRITTSSLIEFLTWAKAAVVAVLLVVVVLYLPENFTTSPGNRRGNGLTGGDESFGTEDSCWPTSGVTSVVVFPFCFREILEF